MHPSVLILIWLLGLVVVQTASVAAPLIVMAACLVLGGRSARRLAVELMWRSRWLWAVLLGSFALMTPGERIGGGLTEEGLALAGLHGVRLASVLCLVAWLGAHHDRNTLLAGAWGLLDRFRVPGRRAFVVRLLLILELAQGRLLHAPGGGRNWQGWLAAWHEAQAMESQMPRTPVEFLACRNAWAVRDWAGLMGAALITWAALGGVL